MNAIHQGMIASAKADTKTPRDQRVKKLVALGVPRKDAEEALPSTKAGDFMEQLKEMFGGRTF